MTKPTSGAHGCAPNRLLYCLHYHRNQVASGSALSSEISICQILVRSSFSLQGEAYVGEGWGGALEGTFRQVEGYCVRLI